MKPSDCSGVVISTHANRLSANAVLLAFKFVNKNSTPEIVDISVFGDVSISINDFAPFETIAENGFTTWSDPYRLTVICLNYSLVSSVTTYWFGPSESVSSMCWTQTAESSLSGVDSGLAFSWQNILLSPGESKTVAVIVKSDVFDSISPMLTLDLMMIPDRCLRAQTFPLHGSVTEIDPSAVISVIHVINSDFSQIYTVASDLAPGSSFVVNLSLGNYEVDLGTYELTFCAVDNFGCVSPGVSFTTAVVPEATLSQFRSPARSRSASRSLTPTRTDLRSRTPTRSQSPSRTCTVSRSMSPHPTPTSTVSPDSTQAQTISQSPSPGPTGSRLSYRVRGAVIGGVIGGVFVIAIVVCVFTVKVFHKGRDNDPDDLALALQGEERLYIVEWSEAVTGKSLMTSEKTA
jgi:hypothetical protein